MDNVTTITTDKLSFIPRVKDGNLHLAWRLSANQTPADTALDQWEAGSELPYPSCEQQVTSSCGPISDHFIISGSDLPRGDPGHVGVTSLN